VSLNFWQEDGADSIARETTRIASAKLPQYAGDNQPENLRGEAGEIILLTTNQSAACPKSGADKKEKNNDYDNTPKRVSSKSSRTISLCSRFSKRTPPLSNRDGKSPRLNGQRM